MRIRVNVQLPSAVTQLGASLADVKVADLSRSILALVAHCTANPVAIMKCESKAVCFFLCSGFYKHIAALGSIESIFPHGRKRRGSRHVYVRGCSCLHRAMLAYVPLLAWWMFLLCQTDCQRDVKGPAQGSW